MINPCLGPNKSSIFRGKTEPSGCQGWSVNLLYIPVALIEAASSPFLCRSEATPPVSLFANSWHGHASCRGLRQALPKTSLLKPKDSWSQGHGAAPGRCWVFLLVACSIAGCNGWHLNMNFRVLAGRKTTLLVQLRKERGSEFAAEKAVQRSAF